MNGRALRRLLIAAAGSVAVGVLMLAWFGRLLPRPAAEWVAAGAVLLVIALLVEHGRYRPADGEGPWVTTAERFQDPASGQWIVVDYNPHTGERRYRSAD
ncbi:MAG TPA: hypothetical protein VKY56_09340 [Chloroflexota bacterium]|nr:hypothetical protein [Chloroflexota bacterium]